MKVRIKKTGEILEVAEYAKVAMDVCDSYGNPLEYGLDEIEIVEDVNRSPDIYWQQVTNQAAIGAMQAMIANSSEIDYRGISVYKIDREEIAERAVEYARALVEELKKDVNV
jgi:hypothetical protein